MIQKWIRLAVAVVVGLWVAWLLANVGLYYSVVRPMCDMGTNKTLTAVKQTYPQQDMAATRGLTAFGNEELEYILERASGGEVAANWSKLLDEQTLRPAILRSLATRHGVYLHGPFQLEDPGKWELLVLYTGRASDAKHDGADWFDLPYPAFCVKIESKASLFGSSYVQYTTYIRREHQTDFATGETHQLFRRSSWPLPNQPTSINQGPREAGQRIATMRSELSGLNTTVDSIAQGHLSNRLGKLDRSDQEELARCFAAIFELVLADRSTVVDRDSLSSRTGNPVRYGSVLQDDLTSKLVLVRLVNGTNRPSGLINFAIVGLLLFGGVMAVCASEQEVDQESRFVHSLVVVLPMLGFLGTLYGMLLGFSTMGPEQQGSKLISYIGISLDTTILAVMAAIVLSLVVMFKQARSNSHPSTSTAESNTAAPELGPASEED